MRAAAFALSLSLAASTSTPFVAAAAGPSFTADFSQTAALNFPLLDCVGSGHGSLALRADYREHLARVQRDIGFKHVRGHGLLHDDMSALLGGRASLANLFSVVDFYLSVGLRPFFEVSYMPQALAADPDALIMHYRACVSAFAADKAQAWAAFVAEVFAGLEARYGADEVRTWSIECWNEPAGSGFKPRPNTTRPAAYFELYEVTARAVASVDPLLRVGGPATQSLLWIPDLLNFTDAGRRVPQSFVSTHYYPTEMGAAEITRTSWEDNITAAADVARRHGVLSRPRERRLRRALRGRLCRARGSRFPGRKERADAELVDVQRRFRRDRVHEPDLGKHIRPADKVWRPKASLPRLRDAGRAARDGRLRGRGRRRRAAAARQWPRCALHGNCRHGRRRHGRRRLAGHDRRAARACHKLQRER